MSSPFNLAAFLETRTVAVNGREVVYTPRRYAGSLDSALVVPAVVGRPAI